MSRLVRILALWTGTLLLQAASAAQSVKLNDPLPLPTRPAGDVDEARISPDGIHAVYLAGQDSHVQTELYSVRLDGSNVPVKLNGLLTPGESVGLLLISPDGQRVVYSADQVSGAGLYSVPIDGGTAPLMLSAADFAKISPDGLRVVYIRDDPAGYQELFSIPIDGSAPASRLHPPLAGTLIQIPDGFEISPDSSRVVFALQGSVLNSNLNYLSAALDGSHTVALGLVNAGFRISSDSSFLVRRSPEVGERGLYRQPIDGSSAPVLLTPVNGSGAFELSPDDQHLVHVDSNAGREEVHSMPADGSSGPILLNPSAIAGTQIEQLAITSDNARVVYVADQDTDTQTEVYSVPITGGAGPVRLNGVLVADRDVLDFELDPDGARVVYRSDEANDEVFLLYSAPVDGASAATNLVPTRSVQIPFALTPDGVQVVYTSTGASGIQQLYRVASDGSSMPVLVNAPLTPGGNVLTFDIDPNGVYVAYRADQITDQVNEVFAALLDVGGPPVRLNDTLAFGPSPGDVVDFDLSSNGRWAVYSADQNVDEDFELFSVPVDGHGSAVPLSGVITNFSGASNLFQIAPGGNRVVYRTALSGPDTLQSVPIDGSLAPVELTLGPTSFTLDYQVAGSGRVVYRTRYDVADPFELYSVPVDGSAGAIQLDPGTYANAFELASDGTRTLYGSSAAGIGTSGLHVVPTDGSSPAVTLAPPSGVPAQIGAFAFSPDGQLVVYTADQDTAGMRELFVVPADASSSSVKLSHALSALGDVLDLRVSPDGQRVVYVADDDANLEQLFSVPIDASLPAVMLNDPLPSGGLVEYAISPDGARVLYTALQDPLRELFSVPVDRGSEPVLLNPPLASSGRVSGFVVDRQSTRVAFRLEAAALPVQNGLYTVPIDGGGGPVWLATDGPIYDFTPDGGVVVVNRNVALTGFRVDGGGQPIRLNGPLVPGGSIRQTPPFRITADGARVVYRASQDTLSVLELYSSRLRKPVRQDAPAESVTRQLGD